MQRALPAIAAFVLTACSGADPVVSNDAAAPRADGGDAAFEDGALADADLLDSDLPGDDAGGSPDATTPEELAILFRVHVPATTPVDDAVHITGNFQNWNPTSPAYALTKFDSTTHEITLSFSPGTNLEFKFTRGTWETVEKSATGAEIANRTHTVITDQTLDLNVGSWADFPPTPTTVTGDVRTTTVTDFLGGRRVWIYLPPSYNTTNDHFPVVYMFDGQNVFDRNTSFSGEWEVDETLETLIPNGEISPIIVVAIDNGGGARIDEYTPWPDPGFGGGDAAMHLAAITDVLIPYIDSHYRTDPSIRGVSGSSLGGLMTLYATYARPDLFNRNAALSPSIWWDDRHIVDYAQNEPKPASIVWMDMGTNEASDAIDDLHVMRDVMLMQGFMLGGDLQIVEDPGAGHNEAAWARRFPDVLRFLFPPS